MKEETSKPNQSKSNSIIPTDGEQSFEHREEEVKKRNCQKKLN